MPTSSTATFSMNGTSTEISQTLSVIHCSLIPVVGTLTHILPYPHSLLTHRNTAYAHHESCLCFVEPQIAFILVHCILSLVLHISQLFPPSQAFLLGSRTLG